MILLALLDSVGNGGKDKLLAQNHRINDRSELGPGQWDSRVSILKHHSRQLSKAHQADVIVPAPPRGTLDSQVNFARVP